MKSKQITKIFIWISFMSLSMTITIPKVLAEDGPYFGGKETSTSQGGSSNGDKIIRPKISNGIKTTCEISQSATSYSDVYINAYDTANNKINVKKINQEFLAGTYIGLNIYEEKGYTKVSTYDTKSYKITYDCYYNVPSTVSNSTDKSNNIAAIPLMLETNDTNLNNINQLRLAPGIDGSGGGNNSGGGSGSATQCTFRFTSTKKCPSSNNGYSLCHEETDEKEKLPTSDEINWCKGLVQPQHTSLYASYEVAYRDSNDINQTSGTSLIHKGTGSCTTSESSASSGTGGSKTITKKCTFDYNREKTCINVKDGKVRYISTSEQCDKNDEYTITMKDNYWKYFIPLNTTSYNDFSVSLNPNNSSKQSTNICKNIIDKYDDYQNLIKPAGSYIFDINDTKEQSKKIIEKAGGCYYQSTIVIPIIQKFYNELSNGKNLKGFNFYYKPIDVNNPFPNGLSTTSIWNDWNDSTIKTPDMSKSYSTITYIAQNINTNTIRTYTANNPYTSWKNMYVNGRSGFIDNEGIVRRNVDNNSYYALGCGPSNTDLETSNAFYQSECDKS